MARSRQIERNKRNEYSSTVRSFYTTAYISTASVECAHSRAHIRFHDRSVGTANGRAGIRWTKGRGERWSSKQTLGKVDAWKERLGNVARPPFGRHFLPSIGILARRNPGGGCWRQSVFSVVVHATLNQEAADRPDNHAVKSSSCFRPSTSVYSRRSSYHRVFIRLLAGVAKRRRRRVVIRAAGVI